MFLEKFYAEYYGGRTIYVASDFISQYTIKIEDLWRNN